MKFITFAAVLIGSILILCASVSARNVYWGKKGRRDHLLGRSVIANGSQWFGRYKQTVTFPPKGRESLGRLTAIRVLDKGEPKNLGFAGLMHGGPGYNTSTILVKARSRRALFVVIEYYGVPF